MYGPPTRVAMPDDSEMMRAAFAHHLGSGADAGDHARGVDGVLAIEGAGVGGVDRADHEQAGVVDQSYPGLAGSPVDQLDGNLHGLGAESVQGFLAGISSRSRSALCCFAFGFDK